MDQIYWKLVLSMHVKWLSKLTKLCGKLLNQIVLLQDKKVHTFTSKKLFEQRRFGLGCPCLYRVKNYKYRGWGNPDRNVVAQTISCWWRCGFAWWLWFPSKNHHWNKKKTAFKTKEPQNAFAVTSGYPDAPFTRLRRAPGHPDDPPLKSFSNSFG